MDCPEQVIKFCGNQKSISQAIINFIDQFMEWYRDEEKAEQEILAQCVRQMFRKYYYSALEPAMMFTPANIVNTLCEREFGAGLMTIPVIDVMFKGKKISRLQYHFECFQTENHPMVKDLEFFLETAASGIRMETPGITLSAEYSRLQEDILMYDRHYINIIGLIALEAGYIDCVKSEAGFTGKRTPKAGEFLCLDSEKKLRSLIETAAALCSKSIIEAFPELQIEFTIERVTGFLKNPESYESAMESVFKRIGIDPKQLEGSLGSEDFMDALQSAGFNEESATKFYWLQNMLDIYFFTPFGYYLQLIQPIYPDIYDLALELDELLSDIDNFQAVRSKLFSPAMEYDLTVLGERLLTEGKKPRRENVIPGDIGDEEMFRVVLESADYLELEDEDFDEDDDEVDDYYQFELDNFFESLSTTKSKGAKVIDFPTKKNMGSNDVPDGRDQVFVFKVKLFYSKRVWRQIEIKGNQSLHDLHNSILDSFGLDSEHLYAFFLSNKFWDQKTEYAHPAAESRSATGVKINRLGLEIKQKIAYIYDFGDEHRFEIELIAVHDAEKKIKYPREVKRNKPLKTVCDECQSDKNPIEWYCTDHDSYLCDDCAQGEEHEECFITVAIM